MSDTSESAVSRRPVRSFVRRAGRLTAAQKRALEVLWPEYGIEYSPAPLDLGGPFERSAPITMEIGFGDGAALVSAAAAHPDHNFLGVEVHEPGVGHCMLELDRAGLNNVKIIRQDAVEVLHNQIADGSLAGINLYFPDPWPKKRHHKRRIVQPEFVALIARKLAPGGRFHVATDWANYAEHIEEVMSSSSFFESLRGAAEREKTKFERRGERLGHEIWERIFVRIYAV